MADVQSIGTSIPTEYLCEFDRWVHSNLGTNATTADGLRALVADIIAKPRLPLTKEKKSKVWQERQDFYEEIAQLKSEGCTWVKIGRAVGRSAGRVRQVHANYERSIKRAAMKAEASS